MAPQPSVDHGGRRERILIIDDEPVNVELLRGILESAGYADVQALSDSAEAERAFVTGAPDLVLLDLRMPPPDGFTLLERFRAHIPGDAFLPILVLTADSTPEARDRALELGAADFLVKPLDATEVLLRIGNLLHTRRLHEAILERAETLRGRVVERTEQLDDSLVSLRRADAQRRRLQGLLAQAEEIERHRIAADIHDDPVQKMTAVGLRLETIRMRIEDPKLHAELGELARLVGSSVDHLRRMLFELRPQVLETDGVGAALREVAARAHADSEEAPKIDVDDRLEGDVPLGVRATVFRIGLEAIRNAVHHADATQVDVVVAQHGNGIGLRVADDGIGFTLSAEGGAGDQDVGLAGGHIGLRAMQERAADAGGSCSVTSESGAGTTVEAWIPIAELEA